MTESKRKPRPLDESRGTGQRDDSIAMQFLRPGWQFDPKRPRLATAGR